MTDNKLDKKAQHDHQDPRGRDSHADPRFARPHPDGRQVPQGAFKSRGVRRMSGFFAGFGLYTPHLGD